MTRKVRGIKPARLAAALVRVSLSPRAASEVTAAVPD
jgi:hypothetical protein